MSYPPFPSISIFPTKRKTPQKQETQSHPLLEHPFLSLSSPLLDPTTQISTRIHAPALSTRTPPPPFFRTHNLASLSSGSIPASESRAQLFLTAQYPLVNFIISRVSHTSLTPPKSCPFAPFAQPSGPSCRFLSRFSFFFALCYRAVTSIVLYYFISSGSLVVVLFERDFPLWIFFYYSSRLFL